MEKKVTLDGPVRGVPKQDRVTLKPKLLEKLSAWIDQAHHEIPGLRITPSDIASWLIEVHSQTLSNEE